MAINKNDIQNPTDKQSDNPHWYEYNKIKMKSTKEKKIVWISILVITILLINFIIRLIF